MLPLKKTHLPKMCANCSAYIRSKVDGITFSTALVPPLSWFATLCYLFAPLSWCEGKGMGSYDPASWCLKKKPAALNVSS